MNTKLSRNFVLLAYGLSWAIALGFALAGFKLTDPPAIVALLGFMVMPAVAAVIMQRRAGLTLGKIGLNLRFNRWLLVAWILPVIWASMSILFSSLLPGVSLTNGTDFILTALEQTGADQAAIDQFTDMVASVGPAFPLLLFAVLMAVSMLGGATVNTLAALGEELGWRGFLQQEDEPLHFWRHSLIVGIIWGLWHAPIILMGHNYPDNPVLGVFVMTVFTVVISPMHTLVREKAGTVLAPSIMHGTINALGGTVLLFLSSTDTMLVGITGLGGFLATLPINALIWMYVQRGGLRSAEISPQPQTDPIPQMP